MTESVYKVALKASDELELRLIVDQNGIIASGALSGVGGSEMLTLLQAWKNRWQGALKALCLPVGHTGPELMLKELILKAQGKWSFPYQDEELCHCRAVPTEVIDQAILLGARTPEIVSRWTSASTACGTCRKDLTAILNYRLATVEVEK